MLLHRNFLRVRIEMRLGPSYSFWDFLKKIMLFTKYIFLISTYIINDVKVRDPSYLWFHQFNALLYFSVSN